MDHHSKHIDRVVWKATKKSSSYSANVIDLVARYPQIRHSLRISPYSLEYEFPGLNVRQVKKWLHFGIDELIVPSSLVNLSNVHGLINLLDSIRLAGGIQVRLEATSKTRFQGLSSIVKSRQITQICHDIPYTADSAVEGRIRAKIYAQRISS